MNINNNSNNKFSPTDEFYMRRAIELAKKGEGWTNPNPLVGAVIVKNGIIIGEGYHHKYGDLHAERDALKNCKEQGNNPEGATIYVTLEPCCHFGKQPPCIHAIKEAGIQKVIVGSRDPNPLVHGKGNQFLRENNIEVLEDFLKDECDALNPIFFHYITTKTPYIALKYAMTLDGKIATKSGKSKWITGEQSRNHVQSLRNKYFGIMVGIGTVIADNPMLNCRMDGGNNPVRIICDSKLRIPLDCKIVKTASAIKTIVASCVDVENSEKINELEAAGVTVLRIKKDSKDHVDLKCLMKILGEEYNIDSILVEGGSELNYSLLEAKLVNHIYSYIAPKLFGGTGKSPIGGEGIDSPDQALVFNLTSTMKIDGDILLEYESVAIP